MKLFKHFILSILLVIGLFGLTACNEAVIEFKLKFIVNDAEYHSITTGGNALIELPENPILDGHKFEGWYWDKDVWNDPFTVNSLLDAPLSSDMKVYAKFSEAHSHTLLYHPEMPGTCTATGNEEYWECTSCNKLYSNATATIEISSFVVLDKIPHSFTEKVVDEVYLNSPATCTEKATYFLSCTCGEKSTFYFEHGEPNGHHVIIDLAVEATCTQTGLTEGSHCDICNTTLVYQTTTYKAHEFKNKIFADEYILYPATCENVGRYYLSCDCGAFKKINPPVDYNLDYYQRYLENFYRNYTFTTESPLGHVFEKNGYLCDTIFHADKCDRCDHTKNKTYHTYDNNYFCNICKTSTTTTKDMAYAPSDDGSYYILTGIGYSTDTDIIIPATINSKPVKEIQTEAFKEKNITSIWMPDSIETIGSSTFTSCSSLKSVRLSPNITQIYDYTFKDCINLEIINIENIQIAHNMAFSQCKSLKQIDCSSLLKTYKFTFSGCKSLTELNLNNLIQVGDNSFAGCSSLIEFHLTDKATSLGINFLNYCSSLQKLTLPFLDINLGYYFAQNTSDPNTNIPASLETVTILGGEVCQNAFANCSNIKNIIIDKNVTKIGAQAFTNCSNIKNIIIDKNVTKIGAKAFANCTSLTNLTLPDTVITIEHDTLENSGIYNNNDNWDNGLLYVGNHLFNAKETLIETVIIPDHIISIADNAFLNCDTISNIIFPDSLENIGQCAFSSCASLEKIDLSKTKLTILNNRVFYFCTLLSEAKLPETLTNIESHAFYQNKNLITITIPDNVINIEANAFGYCSKLQEVVFSNNSKCENIKDYAFQQCLALKTIDFPLALKTIGRNAFADCISIENVELTTNVVEIGYSAFYNCYNIKNITLPFVGSGVYLENNETYFYYIFGGSSQYSDNLQKIYSHASYTTYIPKNLECVTILGGNYTTFYKCSSIKRIILPENLKSIGRHAFYGCTNLVRINIPSSVKNIDQDAFYGCYNLKRIDISSIESWNDIYFYNSDYPTDFENKLYIIS